MLLFNTVNKAAQKVLSYWPGKSSLTEKNYLRNNIAKVGTKGKLRLID